VTLCLPHSLSSNFAVNDTGYRVGAACRQTDDKLMLKLDKPVVEMTIHLQCKEK